jgi:hypothetical protein
MSRAGYWSGCQGDAARSDRAQLGNVGGSGDVLGRQKTAELQRPRTKFRELVAHALNLCARVAGLGHHLGACADTR